MCALPLIYIVLRDQLHCLTIFQYTFCNNVIYAYQSFDVICFVFIFVFVF